jgi:hypothetical protein
METLQISIPKPCHENWDRMTPQEQGRFCDSCCKTVIDFSGKSTSEIWKILKQNENEKICGRFRNDQLNKPVRIELSYEPFRNRLNYSQSFFLSLLIVFGSTLFSCTTHNDETIGEISLVFPDTAIVSDSMDSFITGKIIVEDPSNIVKEESLIEKVQKINRGVSMLDDTIDLPAVDINAEAVPLVCVVTTMGAIVMDWVHVDENKPIPDSITTTLDMSNEETDIEQFSDASIVYPNPAHGNINLKFKTSEEKMVVVELFDLNGRLMRTLLENAGNSGWRK